MTNTTTNAAEALAALVGKKATIFTFTGMGMPLSILCEIKKVYYGDYAQYKNLLHVEFRPKGKRKDYVLRVYYYSTFVVYEGHVLLNDSIYTKTISSGSEVTVRQGETCFSSAYVKNAMGSTDKKPVFAKICED